MVLQINIAHKFFSIFCLNIEALLLLRKLKASFQVIASVALWSII